MFDTMEQKWEAVVRRVCEINETGAPVLIGTRSVLASQEVSRRLAAAGKPHRVLNATQTAQEAAIVAEAGQMAKITVATNMAGRGTDIILGRGVAEIGGLHVVSTEPAASYRVDRQLFGRAPCGGLRRARSLLFLTRPMNRPGVRNFLAEILDLWPRDAVTR